MSKPLQNRIDFAVVIRAKNANPNGDPLDENRPRMYPNGHGFMSDVCLKRKIRDRWADAGEAILAVAADRNGDGHGSLKARLEATLPKLPADRNDKLGLICKTWLDVRAFGQLLAFKQEKKAAGKGKGKKANADGDIETSDLPASMGIRGPVSIQNAVSLEPIEIQSTQITKSFNGEGDDAATRGSDTMGMKYSVAEAVYVTYGSIHVVDAAKTGFTADDADKLKAALCQLFNGDSSAARPAGSMDVTNVVWWTHDSAQGALGVRKVHESLTVDPLTGAVTVAKLNGVTCEVLQGW